MLKQHLEYLSKFGSVRIQKYVNLLVEKLKFKNAEFLTFNHLIILELPQYYKNNNDKRMAEFIKIMNLNNLWYTLYL